MGAPKQVLRTLFLNIQVLFLSLVGGKFSKNCVFTFVSEHDFFIFTFDNL